MSKPNKLLNFVPATKKRGLHGTAFAALRQPISKALVGRFMSELSDRTKKVVRKLYKSREALEVCDMLETECGTEALSCSDWSPEQMERLHFAVLKLATENSMDLDSAIRLAQLDWRDLLMSAGFGNDIKAHEIWAKENAH